jgi:hypothetical protein
MSRHFRIRIQSSCLTAPFFPGLQGSRAFIAREHSHLATASAAAASQSTSSDGRARDGARCQAGARVGGEGRHRRALPVQLFKKVCDVHLCVGAFLSSLCNFYYYYFETRICTVEHSASLFSCLCGPPEN